MSEVSKKPIELPTAEREPLGLVPRDLVRVRSASEIFATLDEYGRLDGLPFMPEMLRYCGAVLPVAQRADKTCAGDGAPRLMPDTVHLQKIRCDGSAHDGCEAGCLTFWKEAWLDRAGSPADALTPQELSAAEQEYVDETLMAATKQPSRPDGTTIYRCQATEIPRATTLVRVRDLSQYRRDLVNWKWPKIAKGLVIQLFNLYQALSKRHLPARLRVRGGLPYPFVDGRLAKGTTPGGRTGLQPGDLVRIKSKEEIVATLDTTGRNRGLLFDGEMAVYCGRVARVDRFVERLVEESTGEMVEIKSDCIILEGVACVGDFHRFCTRAIHAYWRELWLEKLEDGAQPEPDAPCVKKWSRE